MQIIYFRSPYRDLESQHTKTSALACNGKNNIILNRFSGTELARDWVETQLQ